MFKMSFPFNVNVFCACDDYRGKGDYYRLGTDSNAPVKEPQQVETITKKVVQIAVGSLHCLALTENGEVRNIETILTIGE